MDTGDWDAYWRNATSSAAHRDGGPQDEVLEQFWGGLFSRILPILNEDAMMLDIACGNGAVPRFALEVSVSSPGAVKIPIWGLDESPAAVKEMRDRNPQIGGVAASAAALPFADRSFALITSQFGVEYAGTAAFAEAARLLQPQGVIAMVLHQHGGGIYRECQTNLEAINIFRDSGILGHFENIYREAGPGTRGRATRDRVQDTDRQFAASVRSAEEVFRRWGQDIASGTLFRIYSDIGHMYGRLHAYDAEELLQWTGVMRAELDAYAGRMSSMLDAALGAEEFAEVESTLKEAGLATQIRDTLAFGRQNLTSAWVLVAQGG